MNINDLIMSGASEDEIAKAIAEAKTEKARKDEAERLKKEKAAKEEKANARVEALKAEARAYAINAIIIYSQVFGALDPDEEVSKETLQKFENVIKKFEDMIPLYMKLAEMEDALGFEFGLGGLI